VTRDPALVGEGSNVQLLGIFVDSANRWG